MSRFWQHFLSDGLTTLLDRTFGLAVELGSAPDGGIRLTTVRERGPADEAGLRPGDRLLAIDGDRVRDTEELHSLLRQLPGGRPVVVTLARNGRVLERLVVPTAGRSRTARPH
ncbi:MAG: PDZ domain-containing protein [Gemmataceae bacterium]|nr:PDZ domain-containing protein [Gemmataceae bacterium]MDW8263812.1 PDZ domain-containing protein [Gemmataceae bacterium]